MRFPKLSPHPASEMKYSRARAPHPLSRARARIHRAKCGWYGTIWETPEEIQAHARLKRAERAATRLISRCVQAKKATA